MRAPRTARTAPPRSLVLALGRAVTSELSDRDSALRLTLAILGARASAAGGGFDLDAITSLWQRLGGSDEPPASVIDRCRRALQAAPVRSGGGASRGSAVAAMVAGYELALAAIATGGRELRGVFHTPAELARCVAMSVLTAIEEAFELPRGLSDPRLLFIDPAAGAGVFFDALLADFPRTAAPPRLRGFELCPVAIALARLRLAESCGVREVAGGLELRCADALASTALDVAATDIPIIIGNPPYRGHSANPDSPVRALLADYREIDGEPLAERNFKWLQDDYVKFFRLAQATVQRSPKAVIAFVSNHAWLDNPTFRGMRHSLLADFPEVRVLDLGGNRLRQGSPARAEDENVFDISQGVAICLLVRGGRRSVRRHGVLLGTRAQKLAVLARASVQSLTGTRLNPATPGHELTPLQDGLGDEFRRGRSLSELFGVQGPGIVTGRDALVTDASRDALAERMDILRNSELGGADFRAALPPVRERPGWDLDSARAALRADAPPPGLSRYLYRPFHHRYICSHPALLERGRRQVMRHLEGPGALAMVTMRQVASGAPYSHLLVTNCPVDNRVFYSNRGIATVLPLWLDPGTPQQRCNLSEEFVADCRRLRGAEVTPLEAFDAIYATLLAPSYRERYAECLALEYPRVFIPDSSARLELVIEVGRRLRELHLGEGRRPQESGEPVSALPSLGGYTADRILAMSDDPEHARAVLAEMQQLLRQL